MRSGHIYIQIYMYIKKYVYIYIYTYIYMRVVLNYVGARSAKFGLAPALARSCATTVTIYNRAPARSHNSQPNAIVGSIGTVNAACKTSAKGGNRKRTILGARKWLFLGHACLPKHHSNCPTAQLLQPPLLPPQLSDPASRPAAYANLRPHMPAFPAAARLQALWLHTSTSWHAWPLPLQGGQRRLPLPSLEQHPCC